MTAKEYLRQYRYIKMQLDTIKESKEAAYSLLLACGIDPSREKLSAPGGNPRERALFKYLEYSEELDRKYTELIEIKRSIEKIISEIEDPLLSVLLERYYIDGHSWEKVAELIGYSREWTVRRLHPDALRAVEKIIRSSQ